MRALQPRPAVRSTTLAPRIVGTVSDSCSPHQARARRGIRQLCGRVHHPSIVPHNKVSRRPAVSVAKLSLRGPGGKPRDQVAPLALAELCNVRHVLRCQTQRFLPRTRRVGPHERLENRRARDGRVQTSLADPAAEHACQVLAIVNAMQPAQSLLPGRRQGGECRRCAGEQSVGPVRAAGRAAAIFCAENPAHVPEAGLLQERNIGCPMEFKNNSDRDGSVAKDFFAHQDFKDEPTLAAAADCEVWE